LDPHGDAIRHRIGHGIAEVDSTAYGPVPALALPVHRVRPLVRRADQVGTDDRMVDAIRCQVKPTTDDALETIVSSARLEISGNRQASDAHESIDARRGEPRRLLLRRRPRSGYRLGLVDGPSRCLCGGWRAARREEYERSEQSAARSCKPPTRRRTLVGEPHRIAPYHIPNRLNYRSTAVEEIAHPYRPHARVITVSLRYRAPRPLDRDRVVWAA